jgi:hypothetical protein
MGLDAANVYACGAGDAKDSENNLDSFGWFSPIYKHLDLLKEAEAFVAKQVTAKKSTTSKPTTSITCIKGKVTKNFTGPNAKCPKGYKKK